MRYLHQRSATKFESVVMQDVLVGAASVVCQEVVEERGFDAPAAGCGEWRATPAETMEMSWL